MLKPSILVAHSRILLTWKSVIMYGFPFAPIN